MAERPEPRVYIGTDSVLAARMGLCKGGPDFWCGALVNNGAEHKPGCPQINPDTQATVSSDQDGAQATPNAGPTT